jgi:hypothetical protein
MLQFVVAKAGRTVAGTTLLGGSFDTMRVKHDDCAFSSSQGALSTSFAADLR